MKRITTNAFSSDDSTSNRKIEYYSSIIQRVINIILIKFKGIKTTMTLPESIKSFLSL